tara:strand:- start:156 stop:401 length:246 start_codon:yes stop_codon:yes gene_type:complete
MSNDNRLELLEEKINKLDEKLDLILDLLNKEVKPKCDKMGNHINFVETVYENVKNPLGFLCNRIRMLGGTNVNQYTLENNR